MIRIHLIAAIATIASCAATFRELGEGGECKQDTWVDNMIKFKCYVDYEKGVWGVEPVACVLAGKEYEPGAEWKDASFQYKCQLSDDQTTLSLEIPGCISPTGEPMEIGAKAMVLGKGTYHCLRDETGNVRRKYEAGCVVGGRQYKPSQKWFDDDTSDICVRKNGSYVAKATACKTSDNSWLDVGAYTAIDGKYFKCQRDEEDESSGKMVEVEAKEYEEWWDTNGDGDEVSASGGSGQGNQHEHARPHVEEETTEGSSSDDAAALPEESPAEEPTPESPTDAEAPPAGDNPPPVEQTQDPPAGENIPEPVPADTQNDPTELDPVDDPTGEEPQKDPEDAEAPTSTDQDPPVQVAAEMDVNHSTEPANVQYSGDGVAPPSDDQTGPGAPQPDSDTGDDQDPRPQEGEAVIDAGDPKNSTTDAPTDAEAPPTGVNPPPVEQIQDNNDTNPEPSPVDDTYNPTVLDPVADPPIPVVAEEDVNPSPDPEQVEYSDDDDKPPQDGDKPAVEPDTGGDPTDQGPEGEAEVDTTDPEDTEKPNPTDAEAPPGSENPPPPDQDAPGEGVAVVDTSDMDSDDDNSSSNGTHRCEDSHPSCTILCSTICDAEDLPNEEPVGLALTRKRKRAVAYVSWREYNMAYFTSQEKHPGGPVRKECKQLAAEGSNLVKVLCPKACGICGSGIKKRKLIRQFLGAQCQFDSQRMLG